MSEHCCTPPAGNAVDRIIDFTASQGGPVKRDKVWFFVSARYFSVNNFIAQTVNVLVSLTAR